MNTPAIRAALERMTAIPDSGLSQDPLYAAVVRVGLRACDEIEQCRKLSTTGSCCADNWHALRVIANILREAGVPVEVEK